MYEEHPLENRDHTSRGSCFMLSTICICLQESGTSVWLGASSQSKEATCLIDIYGAQIEVTKHRKDNTIGCE